MKKDFHFADSKFYTFPATFSFIVAITFSKRNIKALQCLPTYQQKPANTKYINKDRSGSFQNTKSSKSCHVIPFSSINFTTCFLFSSLLDGPTANLFFIYVTKLNIFSKKNGYFPNIQYNILDPNSREELFNISRIARDNDKMLALI